MVHATTVRGRRGEGHAVLCFCPVHPCVKPDLLFAEKFYPYHCRHIYMGTDSSSDLPSKHSLYLRLEWYAVAVFLVLAAVSFGPLPFCHVVVIVVVVVVAEFEVQAERHFGTARERGAQGSPHHMFST